MSFRLCSNIDVNHGSNLLQSQISSWHFPSSTSHVLHHALEVVGPSSFDLTKICQITKRRNFLKTGQGLWICQVFGTAEVNELAITFISINGKWKNRTSKTPNRQSFCIAFSQEKLTVLHTSRPNQHVLGPQARKCKSRTSFRLSALFIPN